MRKSNLLTRESRNPDRRSVQTTLPLSLLLYYFMTDSVCNGEGQEKLGGWLLKKIGGRGEGHRFFLYQTHFAPALPSGKYYLDP